MESATDLLPLYVLLAFAASPSSSSFAPFFKSCTSCTFCRAAAAEPPAARGAFSCFGLAGIGCVSRVLRAMRCSRACRLSEVYLLIVFIHIPVSALTAYIDPRGIGVDAGAGKGLNSPSADSLAKFIYFAPICEKALASRSIRRTCFCPRR